MKKCPIFYVYPRHALQFMAAERKMTSSTLLNQLSASKVKTMSWEKIVERTQWRHFLMESQFIIQLLLTTCCNCFGWLCGLGRRRFYPKINLELVRLAPFLFTMNSSLTISSWFRIAPMVNVTFSCKPTWAWAVWLTNWLPPNFFDYANLKCFTLPSFISDRKEKKSAYKVDWQTFTISNENFPVKCQHWFLLVSYVLSIN